MIAFTNAARDRPTKAESPVAGHFGLQTARDAPGRHRAVLDGREHIHGHQRASLAMGIYSVLVRGMVSGVVGTVAMTVSELLEMSMSGREGSTVPGQVGAHLMPGRDPLSTADVQALNTPVHWAHGITMGAVRGVLAAVGVRGRAASVAHFGLLWCGDAALYRTLEVADVPWRWRPAELASDLGHKAVYAAVTGLTFDALTARAASRSCSWKYRPAQ